MGYFKKKSIRGENKYYWVIAKRDSKKLGGTGKVKTIEYYLGDRLWNLKYLSWYLWNNDLKLDDVLNKLVIFRLNELDLKNNVNYQISKKYNLSFRSNKDSNIDLRKKGYMDFKTLTQSYIDSIITDYQNFNENIKRIVHYLKSYNTFIKCANKEKYKDTDSYLYDSNCADEVFYFSQSSLESLLNQVPKTQREIAKDRIWGYCLRKCPLEKLDL
ncbi:hypothetical protein [Geminocystis herdmanii]|uniref:hypothetical protein n=1 Tax=Geminocystis herdmanii TaxID=669359 RepID=UPI000347E83C|nr:hypothetical protein [Geminocystis herdmanii]